MFISVSMHMAILLACLSFGSSWCRPVNSDQNSVSKNSPLHVTTYNCNSDDAKTWLLKKEIGQCNKGDVSTQLHKINLQVVIKRHVFPVTLRKCYIRHRRTQYYCGLVEFSIVYIYTVDAAGT